MLNERTQAVKNYVTSNKKTLLVIALFVFGIIMLVFSSSVFSEKEAVETETDLEEYRERLEAELADICSSVSGVGKCRVMITFERGAEKIYKGSVLIESRPPNFMGVTVVCKGAESDAVRAEIVNMMTALFDIGANRISVLKFNS